ncbi:YndJ family transporter [Actinoplanes sp. LDG1-06]|uniref:YndJ family transporter n=1 Tax=Paractinoplanes ovalisporus TaxID=2810368 RepID=A0ABS2AL98_9ACTN|nr:YndJ family transporter [Actinoplanes ovalisporus]MBM2620606.1 YndJ family transporter [Actinoplanes ovalisporus]
MDRLSGAGWVGLHAVVAVCVLLFVPLGLGALGRAGRLARWWPVVAVPAVVAMVVPRGLGAALLCVPYLVACCAVPVLLRRDRLVAFAAACLPVAAAGLLAERGGYALLGFPPGILGLTAAHFHVAGFGALLLLALLSDQNRYLAPAGVAIVGFGFVVGGETGDLIELLGAGVLSAGLWLAIATRTGKAARLLLGLSLVTMGLALLYASGQVVDLPHLNLTWMVLTHGVLNAAAVLVALFVAYAGREQSHTWTHHVGAGRERFEAASRALLTWEMHRRAGAWVDPATPPAFTGQHMRSDLGFGRLRVPEPCEVLEVVRDPARTSLHYLALPGHTFHGDERFTVRLDDDGTVQFVTEVTARPARWISQIAGPAVPLVQWLFIARCARALTRADAASQASPRRGVDAV